MIKVRFAHPEYGDKPENMTVQQTVGFIEKNRKQIGIGRWVQDDQSLVIPEEPFLDTAELARKIQERDGQELVLYPKTGGG